MTFSAFLSLFNPFQDLVLSLLIPNFVLKPVCPLPCWTGEGSTARRCYTGSRPPSGSLPPGEDHLEEDPSEDPGEDLLGEDGVDGVEDVGGGHDGSDGDCGGGSWWWWRPCQGWEHSCPGSLAPEVILKVDLF